MLVLFTAAPLRAPKWYNTKAGVSFGFGGKLVSFRTTDTHASPGLSEVCLIHYMKVSYLLSCICILFIPVLSIPGLCAQFSYRGKSVEPIF